MTPPKGPPLPAFQVTRHSDALVSKLSVLLIPLPRHDAIVRHPALSTTGTTAAAFSAVAVFVAVLAGVAACSAFTWDSSSEMRARNSASVFRSLLGLAGLVFTSATGVSTNVSVDGGVDGVIVAYTNPKIRTIPMPNMMTPATYASLLVIGYQLLY